MSTFRSGKIIIVALLLVSSAFVVAPESVYAQSGLIHCGYDTNADGRVTNPCGWNDFFRLITNVTNYLFILGAAFSAIAFGWAGFLMMTASGEMSKIEHAKQIFGKVLVGFLIMLSAWLIVHAINAGLITTGYFNGTGVQPI